MPNRNEHTLRSSLLTGLIGVATALLSASACSGGDARETAQVIDSQNERILSGEDKRLDVFQVEPNGSARRNADDPGLEPHLHR